MARPLLSNLKYVRDEDCASPQTVSDLELRGIADWAWSKRLEGKVYHGRNSQFRLHRTSLDALKGQPNASDAIALLVVLQDLHGHKPEAKFPMDYAAMKSAQLTDLSRDRFLKARRLLEQTGNLKTASKHSAGRNPRLYRLARVQLILSIARTS